jgi:hypothetical protein
MQATTVQTAPQAPAAPLAPVVAGATPAATAAAEGVPLSVADVRALRAKRSELSTQLESAAGRRARLSSQLGGKTGADRAGIEARIGVLDKRMVQLESDLADVGRQLSAAPGALVLAADSRQSNGMDPDAVAALSAVFTIFVLAPIAFAAARMMWKRTNRPVAAPLPDDASRRLERLEQGMDAIAIEIERVSEGQRFVTRLLSESHGEPLPVSQRIAEQARKE